MNATIVVASPPDYAAPIASANVLGLPVSVNLALPYLIINIAMAYKLLRAYLAKEALTHELGDIIKEVAIYAFVMGVLFGIDHTWSSGPPLVNAALQGAQPTDINALINEAWVRMVKAQQCIANMRLSGPLSAYAPYAEAKLSVYLAVYDSSIWWLSQLRGVELVIYYFGRYLLAIAFALYAFWLRPIAGAIIGVIIGAWLGVLTVAYYGPQTGIKFIANQIAGEDYHPIEAVVDHCDDHLMSLYQQDIDAWRALLAMSILAMSLSMLVGGTAGYVLGRL